MKDVPCLVCGAWAAVPVYVLRRDAYLQRLGLERARVVKVMCQTCELVYSRPQLEPGELTRLYEALRTEDTPSEEHLWWKGRQAEDDFQWVAPHLGQRGRVLDIGCSEGSFLLRFHRLGWETCGIEPSAFARFGQRAYGLDIRRGTFEDASLPAGTFDLVAALRVLEHISDPCAFLTRVKALLRPDGRLYLEVPNAWKPRHRLGEFLGAQHLRLFTRPSLLSLLGQVGFASCVMGDEGRGLRVLAKAAPAVERPALNLQDSNHAVAKARALRLVFWRYQLAYFYSSTLKHRARRSLDWVLGPQRAKACVAWAKAFRNR